ncbi:glucokinase [Prochlorococcus marinus]|uniref:Putative glucokinase n=1 Tax=Prochlorococcus marinus (strain MIT 9211) TaxID=93059 RepID=A9BAX3_PROM4|nr:glucokinase [Prochlorococcus marinus]ABX08985.1 Putative glucokinase [Prochlorococcus marinus str. MIT 9211]
MNLLAGDIGGTKTLLGVYKNDGAVCKLFHKHYYSNHWESFEQILKDFIANIPERIEKPKYGCIAVAGQEIDGSIRMTNLPWKLNNENLCKIALLKQLSLINDFSVLVYGIPFLKETQYIKLQLPRTKQNCFSKKNFAVIGAGTGLGIARGITTSTGVISLPSEGGHKEFAPRTQNEWELTNWLKEDLKINRVSIERIVSGTGLGNIARWRLMKQDSKSHPLRIKAENYPIEGDNDLPEEVAKYAKNSDPIMNEVLNIWLSAYGSVIGDLALQELCYGGLWIGGGTASKHLDGFSSDTFKSAIRNKGRFSRFIDELPIMALTDKEVGLFCAACKAHLIAESNVKLGT